MTGNSRFPFRNMDILSASTKSEYEILQTKIKRDRRTLRNVKLIILNGLQWMVTGAYGDLGHLVLRAVVVESNIVRGSVTTLPPLTVAPTVQGTLCS